MSKKENQKKNLHKCEKRTNYGLYGPAITMCFEEEDKTLWVCNGEYQSQVDFCPFCGKEANQKSNAIYY